MWCMTLMTPTLHRLCACPICGLFQTMPKLRPGARAVCGRCGSVLRQDRTDPAGRALALALTGLLMFTLAATLPFMRIDLGSVRQTTLLTGPEALEQSGMWELALVVLATTMLAPLGKLLAVIWVLLGLRLGWPRRHLVPVFTWVERLSPWSMIEVFMLGVFVAYTKLNDLAPVHMGLAVYALGGLMVAMAATDSALDHEAIWERLERPGLANQQRRQPGRPIGCDVCGQVMHEQPTHPLHKCVRCGARLRHRKQNSLNRAWALLLAAAVLYIPANTLPVLTLVHLGQGEPSTILGGVEELATEGQWPLAVLVFVSSIAVPVLKLGGLALLLITTQLRMAGRLGERTRLYRIVEAVGRWSMVDVFMISILTALVQMGALATISPGPGVPCFCAVVVLTMLAANSFDPRLMWDAAAPPSR